MTRRTIALIAALTLLAALPVFADATSRSARVGTGGTKSYNVEGSETVDFFITFPKNSADLDLLLTCPDGAGGMDVWANGFSTTSRGERVTAGLLFDQGCIITVSAFATGSKFQLVVSSTRGLGLASARPRLKEVSLDRHPEVLEILGRLNQQKRVAQRSR